MFRKISGNIFNWIGVGYIAWMVISAWLKVGETSNTDIYPRYLPVLVLLFVLIPYLLGFVAGRYHATELD